MTAILADIGATSARFGLQIDTEPTLIHTYAVADHASPIDAARVYLAGPAAGHKPDTGVIAAAGPVVNGRVSMTNAAWTVDADRIRQGLGLRALELVEADVRDRGLPGIDLNVWGGNAAARSLYRQAGFAERAVFMTKELA